MAGEIPPPDINEENNVPKKLYGETTLRLEKYSQRIWPASGRFVVAQYDEEGIWVYQAFNQGIAQYAVQNQQFGGDKYSTTRMTWIKPNFLWMMYRAEWATARNQQRILAIKLRMEFFMWLLENSALTHSPSAKNQTNQESSKKKKDSARVNLQWDPDHTPSGVPIKERRAIQLGIKGYCTELNKNVLKIEDITEFVAFTREKYPEVLKYYSQEGGPKNNINKPTPEEEEELFAEMELPKERVLEGISPEIADNIKMGLLKEIR